MFYATQFIVVRNNKSCPQCPAQVPTQEIKVITEEKSVPVPVPIPTSPTVITGPQPTIMGADPVRSYDIDKIVDPLEAPVRRPPRHQLTPFELRRMIDLPTRGYPDNYRLFGTLTNVDDNATDYKILRLYGRERYPGRHMDKYEYYTSISSGNEIIKVPIRTRRKYMELQDDDTVTVDEINCTFKVKLHDFDEPKYHPYFI